MGYPFFMTMDAGSCSAHCGYLGDDSLLWKMLPFSLARKVEETSTDDPLRVRGRSNSGLAGSSCSPSVMMGVGLMPKLENTFNSEGRLTDGEWRLDEDLLCSVLRSEVDVSSSLRGTSISMFVLAM
jgi:hypothetical protein